MLHFRELMYGAQRSRIRYKFAVREYFYNPFKELIYGDHCLNTEESKRVEVLQLPINVNF